MSKKSLVLSFFLILFTLPQYATEQYAETLGKRKIEFGCSENDAEIFVNGKLLGKGNMELVIPRKDCIVVIVKKIGFLTEKIEFCNKRNFPKPPKSYYLELKRDDSFDASEQTDIANLDIELKCEKITKTKAWRLINQIVLSYIDVIEMTDKETGYLRTAWSAKTFKQNTVRTRIIIKQSSDDPLVFKVKLVSEQSRMPITSVKRDELFKEWDRVLRSYTNIIPELQARLK
ncbi:hypothetical protein IMCC3317_35210 [Kordia antarctica]|uniref:PEGA domain-containing protein n=1 Tax=Kordia antarctica TaxID=1218801 RepID=A0A7L4ZNF0_9FLAO|nr:hypothetical protein [Kordia antarctica]QHI38135.1 hypothetical protein IMCC3317_35210 [Kordia antarctica]